MSGALFRFPGDQPENPLHAKSEGQLREEMRGFPPAAIDEVMDLREHFDSGRLRKAMLGVLAFYLPRGVARPDAGVPDETRLREDMGVDSLTLAEAAFKLDELLGVAIETRETAELKTIGDMHTFLCSKLGLQESARST